MRKTLPDLPNPTAKPPRSTSDTLCKRLAEEYPQDFARWLFGARGSVKVEKTELSREPVRADAVIFSHAERETLHAEFQTTIKRKLPAPLRLLDYYVGLKRQNPDRRVRQVLVVLKETGEPIPDRYEDERTLHIRYDKGVIYQMLKARDMLEESVVYQDILQQGEQRGERKIVLRQLERRFGKLLPGLRQQLGRLAGERLEELGEALPDFQTQRDLRAWFNQHAAKS